MKPIRFVCGTRVSCDDFVHKTALGRSLSMIRYAHPPELVLFDNNTEGLSTIYNFAIEKAKEAPAILVFLHDDLYLADFFWMDRDREALVRLDVAGLEGNTRQLVGQPAWMFKDGSFKQDAYEYLSSIVGHGDGFPCRIVSPYGAVDRECKLLERLLLAVDSQTLHRTGGAFDDRFTVLSSSRVERTDDGYVRDDRGSRERRRVQHAGPARRLSTLPAEVLRVGSARCERIGRNPNLRATLNTAMGARSIARVAAVRCAAFHASFRRRIARYMVATCQERGAGVPR